MEPVISTHGLTKHYGGHVALDDVDLEVRRGVLFGSLGPNGAGKTTTIRLLAGLLRPSAGRATVLGADVTRDRETVQRQIGYLPGDFVAYPELTAAEYLRHLGNLRGGVDRAYVERLAKRLDLDQRIGAMSHGNRQKVGIVQALQHDPELLILDEPTQGLDPLVQREFLALLREARDAGRTVFLCSHVLSEVEAVADTVGILRQGRLVEVASVRELRRRRCGAWISRSQSRHPPMCCAPRRVSRRYMSTARSCDWSPVAPPLSCSRARRPTASPASSATSRTSRRSS
jgi:ABC-2 type transport system ATP-binding protein